MPDCSLQCRGAWPAVYRQALCFKPTYVRPAVATVCVRRRTPPSSHLNHCISFITPASQLGKMACCNTVPSLTMICFVPSCSQNPQGNLSHFSMQSSLLCKQASCNRFNPTYPTGTRRAILCPWRLLPHPSASRCTMPFPT